MIAYKNKYNDQTLHKIFDGLKSSSHGESSGSTISPVPGIYALGYPSMPQEDPVIPHQDPSYIVNISHPMCKLALCIISTTEITANNLKSIFLNRKNICYVPEIGIYNSIYIVNIVSYG